jgi:hypothetical protein
MAEERQSELSVSQYESSKIKKEENASEMTHSNSKFRLQSNEKSLSKKSLPTTPAIFGGAE